MQETKMCMLIGIYKHIDAPNTQLHAHKKITK